MSRTPRLHPAIGLAGRHSAAPSYTSTSSHSETSTSRTSMNSSVTRTSSKSSIFSKSSICKGSSSAITVDTVCIEKGEVQERKSTSPSKAKQAWKAFTECAKEHHRSMNSAFQAYYGAGTRTWEYKGRA